jgi:hypothetical protein
MGFYTYSLQNGREKLVRKSDQQTKSAITKVITQRPVLLKKESSVEEGVIAV